MSNVPELIQAVGRAMEGQQVVWVGNGLRTLLESVSPFVPASAKVRRARGSEDIRFVNGGRIRFLSLGPGGRGFSCDRVYVPAEISDTNLMHILPSLNGSKDGALIYYEKPNV